MLKIKTPYKVSEDLKEEILSFVNNNEVLPYVLHGAKKYDKYINKMLKVENIDTISPALAKKIIDFGNQVFDDMGMNDRQKESYLDYSVFIVENGGYIHTHIDALPPEYTNYIHVRMNFLLTKPITGGDPIIEGTRYDMDQDQSWINLASMWSHGCNDVVGDIPRITLTLGHYVRADQVKSFLNKLFK